LKIEVRYNRVVQKERGPIEEESGSESNTSGESGSYYYDDAHGYEEYDPESSADDDEKECED